MMSPSFVTTPRPVSYTHLDVYKRQQFDLTAVINPDYTKAAMMAAVFSFGLVAFGFLGMGPVPVAVDSYGRGTDNAQSV